MARRQQYSAEIKFGGSIDASLRQSLDTWQQQFESIGAAGKAFEAQVRDLEKQLKKASDAGDTTAFKRLEQDLHKAERGARQAGAAQRFLVGQYALHKQAAADAADKAEEVAKAEKKLADAAKEAADKQERLADAFRHAAAERFLDTMGGIVDMIGEAVRGMAELGMSTAEWGVNVNRTATTVGATPEAVQRIQQAFAAAGVDAQTTNDALVDISERIGEGATDRDSTPAQALRRLGLDPTQLNRQSADSQIEELIRATQGQSAGEANFVLRDILGDEAARAIMALRTEGSGAFRDRIDNAVTVDTAELERFSRMMTTLMTNAQLVAAEFFSPIMEAFSDELGDGALDMRSLTEQAGRLGDSVAEAVPHIVDLAEWVSRTFGGLEGMATGLAGIAAVGGLASVATNVFSIVQGVRGMIAAVRVAQGVAASGALAEGAGAAAGAASAAGGAGGLAAVSARVASAFGLLLTPLGLVAAALGAVAAIYTVESPEGETMADFWGSGNVLGELADSWRYITGNDGQEELPASVREGTASARAAAGDATGAGGPTTNTTNSQDNRQYNIAITVADAEALEGEIRARTEAGLR